MSNSKLIQRFGGVIGKHEAKALIGVHLWLSNSTCLKEHVAIPQKNKNRTTI